MSLPATLALTHDWVRRVLFPGSLAVDATIGNGNDTLFLARAVGTSGQVYGFDIQQEALDQTWERLRSAGVADRVTLHRRGHHQMEETLPPDWRGRVNAAMFNLGYLPKGDPTIITRPDTTLSALKQSLEWLAPGGIITVMLYTGHPGGKEEADQVTEFLQGLDSREFRTVCFQTLNRHQAPFLIAVSRSGKVLLNLSDQR